MIVGNEDGARARRLFFRRRLGDRQNSPAYLVGRAVNFLGARSGAGIDWQGHLKSEATQVGTISGVLAGCSIASERPGSTRGTFLDWSAACADSDRRSLAIGR